MTAPVATIRTRHGGGCTPPRKIHKWEYNTKIEKYAVIQFIEYDWVCVYCGKHSNHRDRAPRKRKPKLKACSLCGERNESVKRKRYPTLGINAIYCNTCANAIFESRLQDHV